jgi:hypothetical protein
MLALSPPDRFDRSNLEYAGYMPTSIVVNLAKKARNQRLVSTASF